MKRISSRLAKTDGFSLVEIIIVLAIIGILASITTMSYKLLQARMRYSAAKANMDAIAMAGYTDYTTNNIWAWMPMPGLIPQEFVDSHSLATWPSAPCPNWAYSWDNWSNFPSPPAQNVIRVSLRNGAGTTIWSYCVDNVGGSGDCMFQDPLSLGTPINITLSSQKYIYCSE